MIKYSLLAMCLCLHVLHAAASLDTLTRQVTKTYAPAKNDRVCLSNSYGNIKVSTWGKKQVQFCITITAMGRSKKGARLLLGRVSITAMHENNQISARTSIVVDGKQVDTDGNCQVKYVVFLPDNMPLRISNRFGDITMTNYSGPLEVDEKFGNFTANVLSKLDSLKLEGGNATIAKLWGGNVFAKAFEHITIDSISNDVQGTFALGQKLDVGLLNGHYSFTLQSKNVQAMQVHLEKNLFAKLSLNAVLSKVINHSSLVLKRDTAQQITIRGMNPQKDSVVAKAGGAGDTSSSIILKKKIDALVRALKKTVRYTSLSGDGRVSIDIKGTFSQIEFDDGDMAFKQIK